MALTEACVFWGFLRGVFLRVLVDICGNPLGLSLLILDSHMQAPPTSLLPIFYWTASFSLLHLGLPPFIFPSKSLQEAQVSPTHTLPLEAGSYQDTGCSYHVL